MNLTEMGVTVLVAGALGYLTWLYFKYPETYNLRKMLIRKAYYGLIIIVGLILFWLGELATDIPTLAMLAILVVLVDLAVFQTPNITKFMSHEFNHDVLDEAMVNSNKRLALSLEKLVSVNAINKRIWHEEALPNFDFTWLKYEEYILKYLHDFAQAHNMEVIPYYITLDEEPVKQEDKQERLKKHIERTYKIIEKKHEFTLLSVGMKSRTVVRKLADGESITIGKSSGSFVLIPYFGTYHNSIIVLKATGETDVSPHDTAMVLNMLFVLDAWLECNEDLLIDKLSDEYDEETVEPASEGSPSATASDTKDGVW